MDILVAAENLRRLQARIDARLNDARVDRDQVEKRYDMGGRHFAHLSLPSFAVGRSQTLFGVSTPTS